MIEKLKNENVESINYLNICQKEIETIYSEMLDDNMTSSEYIKNYKNDIENIKTKTSELSELLSQYDQVLNRLIEVQIINEQIKNIQMQLLQSPTSVELTLQMEQLKEQRKNIINQAKMISYE